MDESSSVLADLLRGVHRVAYALLVAFALYAVLTAEWPEAAALAFLFATWYDVRASETLRRVRAQLLGPADHPT